MKFFLGCALFGQLMACQISQSTVQPTLKPLQTVAFVDLERYLGTWYEIASFPQPFQKNCVATMATYSALENGQIEIRNQCHDKTLEGPLRQAKGRAKVVSNNHAQLKVSFFWPFWGDYWVILLDEAYRYAVVGHPQRKYLWILSRTPHMPEGQYDSILEKLLVMQYDIKKLNKTLQSPSAIDARDISAK